jgi:hypothetical protein
MKKILILFTLFLVSCESTKLEKEHFTEQQPGKTTVSSYKKLNQFSSGSGMAYYNNHFYIVGDDDPYLAKLNKQGDILQRWLLWDTADVNNGRLDKKVKPDFEAISLFPLEEDTLLLIFGSGSKSPKRDVILTFHPKKEKVDTLQGKLFFAWLKEAVNLSNDEINLEGAAYHNGFLHLLNRHNNTIYTIAKEDFSTYIATGRTNHISVTKKGYELPVYKNDTARFSGASIIGEKDQILFSASIESTDNWEEDGKILGSFIGKIDLNDLENQRPFCAPIFKNDTTRFEGKIEALHGINNENKLHIYFITDDDDGTTGWGEVLFND